MAGHHSPASTGYHSPTSPNWQDPREREWHGPVSLGYQAAPASGWQSPPISTYQNPTGPEYYSPTLPPHHSPTQAGSQNRPAPGYQSWPVQGHMVSSPVGYPNPQSPGHQSPQGPGAQYPVPAEYRNRQLAGNQNPPVSGHQYSSPGELPGQQVPPAPVVSGEAATQRTRFSLTSVMPRRTSEQLAAKESKSPPPRRDTVSGVSLQSNPTQISAGMKSDVAGNTPYDLGKTSGWYRGLNYDVEEMWTNAMRRDSSAVSKCLKAGLNVNYCRWHKNEGTSVYSDFGDMGLKDLGQGARTLADVVAYKNDTKTMRLLMENQVDLSGASSASFVSSFRSQFTYKYSAEERKAIATNPWTTPLHLACKRGHIDMIHLLLEEGRVDPNTRDAAQQTGLHMAIIGTKLNVAKLLVERGASIHLADSAGTTPLAAAAAGGKLELVNFLLDNGATVDAVNNRGITALYSAALNNRFDIVKSLLSHGADVDVRSADGMSALFAVASSLDVRSMELLTDFGGNIDSRDNNGCTALLRATMAKNILLMTHLLHLGADIDMGDNDGWTPLFVAMLHNDDTLMKVLLANGPNLEQADSYGNTALHQAALLGSTLVVRHIVAVQLNRNTTRAKVNILGETPLILAAKHNRSAAVKVLLKHGADPHYVDPNGYRAIDRAMYWGSHACINQFSQIGVNVDSQAYLAVQQGKADNPGSGLHDIIINRTPPQYSVSRKPMNTTSSQMRDIFARTVTWTTLMARMREKQGKPVEDPKPVQKPTSPAAANPSQSKPTTDPKQSLVAAPKEEEEEYVSPDPFEACIPKLPPSLIINNHMMNVKGGINKVEAGGMVAGVALGIAGTVLGV